MDERDGVASPVGGARGGVGMEGTGSCHLGGGEGGHWPANMWGQVEGLGGALLSGWAKPSTCTAVAA